ncbi:hypothetical protein CAL26_05070 [Bordetella genomosp. 9]|uniref:Uncharacterized protein n=1 Tax=Bordetella genomosp. 9 TaxID=1416803 RepID=A0A261RP04_9BORD|nr:hypothetical protein [Bordetella genomosp. 9]OZI26695.1 hypothetical protein CAL26_05070 [Bordetella genomosp. 9]
MTHDQAHEYATQVAREEWAKAGKNMETTLKALDRRAEKDPKFKEAREILSFRSLLEEQQTRH